jgi:hypothetical protein
MYSIIHPNYSAEISEVEFILEACELISSPAGHRLHARKGRAALISARVANGFLEASLERFRRVLAVVELEPVRADVSQDGGAPILVGVQLSSPKRPHEVFRCSSEID